MKGLNAKVLLLTMLAAGLLAAALGIAEIWFDIFEAETLVKILVTVTVVGFTAGFLMAVDYDMPSSRQKTMLLGMSALILAMGGLIIAQLWWLALEWLLFAKIFGTVFILFILVSFITAIKEDFGTHKKLKDENYLD